MAPTNATANKKSQRHFGNGGGSSQKTCDIGPVDWSSIDPVAKANTLAPGAFAACQQCIYFKKLPSPFGEGSTCSNLNKPESSPICHHFEPMVTENASSVALALLDEVSAQELLALSMRLAKMAKAKLAHDEGYKEPALHIGGLVLVRYEVGEGVFASDYRLGIITFKDLSKVHVKVWHTAPAPSGSLHNLESLLNMGETLPLTKINGKTSDIIPARKWAEYLEAFAAKGCLNRPGAKFSLESTLIFKKSALGKKLRSKNLDHERMVQIGELVITRDGYLAKVAKVSDFNVTLTKYDYLVNVKAKHKLSELVMLEGKARIGEITIDIADVDELTPIEQLDLDKLSFSALGLAPSNFKYDVLKKRASLKEGWERRRTTSKADDYFKVDGNLPEEFPILDEDMSEYSDEDLDGYLAKDASEEFPSLEEDLAGYSDEDLAGY